MSDIKNRIKITQITIIQNKILYKKFVDELETLNQLYNQRTHVYQLFHGTGKVSPQVICKSEIGFDTKYSKSSNLYGQGIYFANKAAFSYKKYGYKKEGQYQLLLCTVIVGESYLVSNKVNHPPDNPHFAEFRKRYDSVYNGDGVYVIFENGRAYPSFLITYDIIC